MAFELQVALFAHQKRRARQRRHRAGADAAGVADCVAGKVNGPFCPQAAKLPTLHKAAAKLDINISKRMHRIL